MAIKIDDQFVQNGSFNLLSNKAMVRMGIPIPCASLAARDGIPSADRLVDGKYAKAQVDDKIYKLVDGTANDKWQEVITGGDVDPAMVESAVNTALANSDLVVTKISGGTFIGVTSVTDIIRGGTF